MQKTLFCLIFLSLVFPLFSNASEAFQLPENTKELIGKTIIFETVNHAQIKSEYAATIMSISKHSAELGQLVIVGISSTYSPNDKVTNITYQTGMLSLWMVNFERMKPEQIQIISIE
ncbi:hypothetical protein KJ603_00790 [Patescibacteria group bacterium]|nr:hypothetical protein [Patescibacteria group bacterium]